MPSNPSGIYLSPEDECQVSPSTWRCACPAPSRTWISNHTCKWCDCLEEEISFELLGGSVRSFVRSFCSPAHLEIVALSSLMCFSFVIHEMEMIILICLPHRFVKRINWCLDRVLKPHANIKVTLNRPRGITELSKKKKRQLEVELSSCFTAVWVSRLTLCVLLWICRAPVSLFKGVHHGRLLCFKIPFTTQFSCLLPSLSVCKRLSFRHFRELQKCFENPQLQDCFQFS